MAKKIIGVILFLIGIGAIGGSMYISNQVAQGQEKIKKAEKTIEGGKELFGLNPVTKEIGKGISKSADKKLGEGKDLVAHYTKVANVLMIGGIVLAVAGVALFFLPCSKKKRR